MEWPNLPAAVSRCPSSSQAQNHRVALPELLHCQMQASAMDIYDQDVKDATGHAVYDVYGERRRFVMLPGAWAMGDGLVLDVDADDEMYLASSSNNVFNQANGSSTSWSVESLGSQVARFAGSFRSSVGGYINDLATAWTSDVTADEGEGGQAPHTTLIDGEIAWIPRSSSKTVVSDKKQK